MKAAFLGDIPLRGGTSGSSSKAVTDFLLFLAAGGIFEKPVFRGLIEANGARADPSPSPLHCTVAVTDREGLRPRK